MAAAASSLNFSGCVQAYDANSNPVDCYDPSAVVFMDAQGNTVGTGQAQGTAAALALATANNPANNPVAASATGANVTGGTSLSSLFASLGSLGTSITTAVAGPAKPATTPVTATGIGGLFSGTTGILLLVAAIVIAFFAFGGRRRAE